MFNRPKVLVCTDFSERSDDALKVGHDLTLKFGGELFLVHAAEVGFYISWRSFGVPPREQNRFSELIHLDLMERMDDQMKRCSVRANKRVVFASSSQEAILETISELSIDLVVMGDRGHQSSGPFYLGSLSRKMASSAPVPLLVVKRRSLKNIAGLIEPFEDSDKVLNCAEELSMQLPGKLSFVSLFPQYLALIKTQAFDYSSSLLHSLKKIGEEQVENFKSRLRASFALKDIQLLIMQSNENDIGFHLTEILHENEIDLAIMKKHNKNWVERHILGSVSSRVLELFDGNILIL